VGIQEFNTFQQALKECAFDNTAFMQCFGPRREIASTDFADCFRHCSSDTFRTLMENLGEGNYWHAAQCFMMVTVSKSIFGSVGSVSSQLKGVCAFNLVVDERQFMHLESTLSSLRWGHTVWKRVSFILRSLADLSCDFHCQSVIDLLQAFGFHKEWWVSLESVSPLSKWIDAARAFLSPKHIEHERDFVCRSIFCSLEDELAKSSQQHELDDQQQNLPQGTSARQAALLAKLQIAGVNVLTSVDGVESLSIEGSKVNVVCEIEHFDLFRLLREAVKSSRGQSAA
jgi:hypothetical protein